MKQSTFSISLKIFDTTPAHISFYVYCALLPDGLAHEDATRASSGQLVMRVKEFDGFVRQLKPHVISIDNADDEGRFVPAVIEELYEFQDARGQWDFPKYILK